MTTKAIEDSTVFSRGMEVVAADMDGETVMISIESGKYYGMDAVGSRIWELLASPKSLNDLIGILVDEYEVDRDQCRTDVAEFLNYLSGEGLVKFD